MATVLEKAKLERKTSRRLFTLAAEKIQESLTSKDRTDIKARFKNLSDKYSSLTFITNRVQSLWLDVPDFDEAAFEADLEQCETYCERWFMLQQQVEEIFNPDPDPDSPEGTVVSKKHSSVSDCQSKAAERLYLPKIELPRFDGNIKGWIAFWGLFKKIHTDDSIQNDLKFQYLLQCMEPGSPARALIESFPPCGANYNTAIEQLKARYGRDDLLIEVYVRELLSLVLDQSKGTSSPIGTLYDKLKTQLHCLESLDVTSDKYAAMLRPLVESAMPIDLLRVWERSSANKKTLNDLLDFLKQEVESEERIKISHKISYSENFPTPSSSTAACFTTAVNTKDVLKQEKSCLWCERTSHTSSECSLAIKKSLEERREFIKKKNACSICLNIGHFWKRCKKYPRCVICAKRHYPIMCPQTSSNANNAERDPPNNVSFQNSIQKNDTNEAQKAVLSQSMPSTGTVLLQTLKLNIVHGNQTITVRALLDSGAQHSFVTNDVVQKLNLAPCGQASLSHSLFGGVVTKKESYKSYVLNLRSIDGIFEHRMTALAQNTICNYLPKLKDAQLIADLKKRVNWPLGLVVEVFQGADGCVRVARLKTKNGERIRPLLRLFPLECSTNSLGSSCSCSEHWLQCSTGLCIPPDMVCDGRKQCPSGEDEMNCGSPRTCPEHWAACSTGRCVRPDWVCDGESDCPGLEDEMNCGSPRTCPEHWAACSTGRCVRPDWVCDGESDCPGLEDELNCGTPRTCPEHWAACSSGRCVSPHWICDGTNDCPQREDEEHCDRAARAGSPGAGAAAVDRDVRLALALSLSLVPLFRNLARP